MPRPSNQDARADLSIRPGNPDDDTELSLFDEAIDWLVARDQVGQWGSRHAADRPDAHSGSGTSPRGGLRIAERSGRYEGAPVVGSAPGYVSQPDRPELYILLVLSSRQSSGQGMGARLIDRAVTEAQAQGAERVRVDCWAGAPSLIAWYRNEGFQPTETFELNGWRGQILAMRLNDPAAHPSAPACRR